jgi:hypothetical protein
VLNANHGQREPHLEFIVETNLDMINAILLKLHAAEDVDVCDV